MISSKKILMIGLLLIGIAALLAACSGAKANVISSSAPLPTTANSGLFKAANLAVNPPEVNAGIQTLISAQITNLGQSDQTYDGRVRIDSLSSQTFLPGLVAPPAVTIPAGTTKLVSVTATINYPGTYKVTWEDSSAQVVVNPQDTSGPQGAPAGGWGAAADFSGIDVVTGKQVTLKQFAGSAVLLNFVNYGCDPSLNSKVDKQLQAIQQLARQRPDFVPLSVFCGCCPPEVLRQFAQQNNFNWPWILDTNYTITPKYSQFLKKYGYPTLVFIDGSQNIVDVSGYSDLATLSDKINQISSVQAKY